MENHTQKNKIDSNKLNIDEYLKTDHQLGLSEEEAKKRNNLFGQNILVKSKRQSFFVSFIKAILFELMSLLLFVTGLIGLALAIYENVENSPHYVLSYVQTGVLLSIVIINALFGTLQERKSSNAIDELEKMSSPTSKVLRDGKIKQIDSNLLTIGDIIIVEAGDTISADAILFNDSHLKISEAILTGESTEVLKDADYKPAENAPIGDQKNKIFSGTSVLNGKGYAIVCAIGNNTEIGKIAELLSNNETMLTPLQLKLQKLGKVLGIFGIVVTILTFIFSLLVIENVFSANVQWVAAIQSSLLLAISLAAAAIPEGLSAIVTIVLSIGVKKMTARNALIKKLPSVETLGSTSVICSDKTGTLTMNKMTIVKLWTENDINNEDADKQKIDEYKIDMLKKASLCCDGVIDETEEISLRKAPIGDPTEIAILDYTFGLNISILNLKNKHQRIKEIPFDSDRKLMSTINVIDGKKILIVKGAPDVVISKCKKINDKELASKINNKWSDSAIRVLAIAQKEIKDDNLPDDLNPEDFEFDLEFLGLVGMIDPPREEVKLSINECISAGIKPIMITGDHLNTAIAIAKDLGIIKNEQKQLAITGAQLDEMSDEEFNKNIEKYSVYARVSPENKIRIVKAWQAKDQVVAMTGDGVNDAPALKAADIGCAMGITGTDVSKQASDMILMDDNFSTIVEAVKLGRNIYENIRRIAKFLLSSNVTGVFAIVVGMFIFYGVFETAGWGKITINDLPISWSLDAKKQFVSEINANVKFTTAITTIQILINHMVIETFPGVALGTQMTISDFMYKRPRSKYESIFADKLIWQILASGLFHGILTVVAYAIGSAIAINTGAPLLRFYYGSVAAFITLTIGGILKSISMCSSQVVWKLKWEETKWIYITSIVSFILAFIVIFIPKLNGIVAEYPELDLNDFSIKKNINQQQFNNVISSLSNNMSINSFPPYSIYLVGFSFGLLMFIFLEVYKIIELKLTKKEKANSNKEFEIILRPITFKEKLQKRFNRGIK